MRSLVLALLFTMGTVGVATADPRMEGRGGVLHVVVNPDNQDDEIKLGGALIPIYEDAYGFAQGYVEALVPLPCGMLSEVSAITDVDSDGACTMVDDGGNEYIAYKWASSIRVTNVDDRCTAAITLDCMDGMNAANNLDPEALADWDGVGNVIITDNGNGEVTAAGFVNGYDSFANNVLAGSVDIEGRRFFASYEARTSTPGCVIEFRIERLAGGDGEPIVNESYRDVVLGDSWQEVMVAGTGVAGNRGLKALITGGIDSGDVCHSIDVRRRYIAEVD